MNINTKRRKLLSALSLAAVPVIFTGLIPSKIQASNTSNKKDLQRLLPLTKESQRFGRIYLEMRPAENNLSRLLQLLTESENQILSHTHQRIKAMQLEDLRQNRILFLDGWPITVTEARLCALSLFY